MEKLIAPLEERLALNNQNRKAVQGSLQSVCAKALAEVDQLEKGLEKSLQDAYSQVEERSQALVGELSSCLAARGGTSPKLADLVRKAQTELTTEHRFAVERLSGAGSFSESYTLTHSVSRAKKESSVEATDDQRKGAEHALAGLQDSLGRTHEQKVAAQDEIRRVCASKRREVDGLKEKINGKLEAAFSQEDARLQGLLSKARECANKEASDETRLMRAKAVEALVHCAKYKLLEPGCLVEGPLCDAYDLEVVDEVLPEYLELEKVAPTSLACSVLSSGEVRLSFSLFREDEVIKAPLTCVASEWLKDSKEVNKEEEFRLEYTGKNEVSVDAFVMSCAVHCFKVCVRCHGKQTMWSDTAELTAPEFSECCVWKKCPSRVEGNRKYDVDEKCPVAAKSPRNGWSTVVGSGLLPPGKATEWHVRILKSKYNDCDSLYVGVAPSDINQNEDCNYEKCGWYLN